MSRDLTAWHELRFRSHELYARQSIVSTVGCRAGRLAMLAEKSGGAHGLPRVRLWRETTPGTLRSMPVPTELFGGPSAVSVNRLVGARAGWLVTGSRTSGAAVWSSRTARSFTLHDGQPGLASDRRGATTAYDEVALGGSGAPSWLLVGALRAAGRPSRPVAFSGSPERGWSREPMPSTASFATAERVVAGSDGLVAVGLDGDGFGTWTRDDAGWTRGPDFAPRAEDAGSAAFVSGLASHDGAVWATLSDGATFELWRGDGTSWEQVDLPVDVPVTGSNAVTVVAGRDRLLLLVSDGEQPRVYATPPG